MFKSLSPGLLALVLMLFEYLSGGASFRCGSPRSWRLRISLPASTPLRSRNPLTCLVRFTIYSTHVISNSNLFAPLTSLSISVWSWDSTQSRYARGPKRIRAICRRNEVWSIRSGPSQYGQCPAIQGQFQHGASNQSFSLSLWPEASPSLLWLPELCIRVSS
jgi:hypothetical protein